GRLFSPNTPLVSGHVDYVFSRFKSTSSSVRLIVRNPDLTILRESHSGSSNFENVSTIVSVPNTRSDWLIGVADNRAAGWDNVEVDYINAIDLTEVFGSKIPSK